MTEPSTKTDPTKPTPEADAMEAFIQRGRARMQAAIEAQPYRGSADFDDLMAVGEALLRHLVSDSPMPVEPPTKVKKATKDESSAT